MTGGRVVVWGPAGRNFAAGMSGGIAYVLEDDAGQFKRYHCNTESVDLDPLKREDEAELVALIEDHLNLTGGDVARRLLGQRSTIRTRFVKVMPKEYKTALARMGGE
jgi:glutamate synthase (NADPH) large chain